MKQIQFTEEELYQFGIYQLRDIARKLGVHLPTTYKKEELIEQILKIQSGELKPFVAKNKKGRPPKNFVMKTEWTEQELKNISPESKTSWSNGKWVTMKFPELLVNESFSVSSPGIFETEDMNVRGIIYEEKNGWGTIHVGGLCNVFDNNLAVIPPSLMREYSLKSGDEVFCRYKEREGLKTVYSLTELNGKSPRLFKRLNFEKLTPLKSNEVVPLWNDKNLIFTKFLSPIGKGQRAVVVGEKGSGKSFFLFHMAEEFAKNGIHTIFVSLDKRPEDKVCFSENVETIFAPFDVVPFRQMYLLNLAIEKAKRLCEIGKDVAVFVDDLLAVVRSFEYCLEKEEHEKVDMFDLSSIIALKKIMATSKKILEGGSLTFVGCLGSSREEEKRLFELVDDLCNSHIFLSKELLNFSKINVLPKSFTDNSLALLPEKDFNVGQQIKSECYNKNFRELAKIYEEKMKIS